MIAMVLLTLRWLQQILYIVVYIYTFFPYMSCLSTKHLHKCIAAAARITNCLNQLLPLPSPFTFKISGMSGPKAVKQLTPQLHQLVNHRAAQIYRGFHPIRVSPSLPNILPCIDNSHPRPSQTILVATLYPASFVPAPKTSLLFLQKLQT